MGLHVWPSGIGERNRGDIVLGWLVKVTLVLTVLGVCVFDGISVAVTRVRFTDDATAAASVASESWQRGGSTDLQAAYDTASRFAGSRDEQVPTSSFRIDRDGTVHLRLRGRAATLLLHRLRPMAGLAEVDVSGSARATS